MHPCAWCKWGMPSERGALQDSEGTPEESEALLARQFRQLDACLMDEAPAVRAAAVKGVCGLLNVWWEIVPQATLIGFLRRITGMGPSSPPTWVHPWR